MKCEKCGGLVPVRSGRVPKFCSSRCRQSAYRARKKAEGLPARMTGVDRWTRCVGKRPITVEGRSASSTDESTWTTFKSVCGGPGDGFGVMLGDGLACLDLDHCFDGGELTDWARREIGVIESPIWIERSISGDGIHVFFEGRGVFSKHPGVEWYFHSRFIRVTGNRYAL